MVRAVRRDEGDPVSGNAIIDAAIASELAGLARVVDVPAGPYGYGTDLSCVTDLTADFAEVDPQSRTAVAQAVIRRLITPRGGLIDDPDYGYDVRGLCNRATTPTELRALGDQCRAEARKDDRVQDATVTATYDDGTRELRLTVMLTCEDPALGTFTFTFAVTASGAELMESIR